MKKSVSIILFFVVLFLCNKTFSQNQVLDSKTITKKDTTFAFLFNYFKKVPQTFTVSTNKDTTIIGKEGTRITIPANAFINSKTGKEINGAVQFELQEYYKISDIVLAKLSTTSNGQGLETGGMLHISANQNKENCTLKKDKEIKFEFPYTVQKEGMQLFSGNFQNDTINWKLLAKPQSESVFTSVEQMPQYAGGESEMMNFISRNTRYPKEARDKNISGQVLVRFIVDEKGEVKNPEVIKGVEKSLNNEALSVVRLLPKFKAGRQNGKNVSVQMVVPFNFELDEDIVSVDKNAQKDYAKEKAKKEKEKQKLENQTDKAIQKGNIEKINYYLLSSSGISLPSFVNCDRFSGLKRINYFVKMEDTKCTMAELIYHDVNSVFVGKKVGKKFYFPNSFLNQKATIIAFKVKDKQVYFASKEITVQAAGETLLDFQPVTLEKLKSEIEKLNKL